MIGMGFIPRIAEIQTLYMLAVLVGPFAANDLYVRVRFRTETRDAVLPADRLQVFLEERVAVELDAGRIMGSPVLVRGIVGEHESRVVEETHVGRLNAQHAYFLFDREYRLYRLQPVDDGERDARASLIVHSEAGLFSGKRIHGRDVIAFPDDFLEDPLLDHILLVVVNGVNVID